VALAGSALLLLLTRSDPDEALKAVEWSTLFFFIGLFVMVEGLRTTGFLDQLAQVALSITDSDLILTSMMLLWFGALASAVIGAVPLVTTLIPVIHTIIPEVTEHTSVDPEAVRMMLWWSLALGACFGGNGTMFGTAANIVVVQIARKNKHDISFGQFMAYGAPITVLTLVISSAYLLLRYAR
jgi:Na+/H+ antiporter NhaD/arsenite permease-like protein